MIKINRILVPTDFSLVSLGAVRYGLSLARDHGAEFYILHVVARPDTTRHPGRVDGEGDEADEGLVRIQIGNKLYTPIELSSFVLLELKQRAEEFFGEPEDPRDVPVLGRARGLPRADG